MGNTRTSWHEVWGSLAVTMGTRSRCDRAKIGAVIVSAENRVVATGYNGPPRDWAPAHDDITDRCRDWCVRAKDGNPTADYSDCPSNHAEINALMHSSRSDREGGAIYVNGSVCMSCAKAIANSGIQFVMLVDVDKIADAHRRPMVVEQFLLDCGLCVLDVELPPAVASYWRPNDT